MKHSRPALSFIALVMAATVLLSSCASTTLIQTNPSGARLYLNGQSMGATPYTHRDTKLVGSTTQVRIEMEGYETLNTSFSKDEQIDVGAAIAGCFVWVPFIWVMKYAPVHSYDLTPVSDKPQPGQKKPASTPQSKAEKLRELKQLLDEKIITQEEFDAEKKKILNGPE